MSRTTRYELTGKIYRHAVAALVAAVCGQKLLCEPYSEPIKDAAKDVVDAFEAGRLVYKDGRWRVHKKFDDAIAALVGAVGCQKVPRGPYHEQVYRAAMKFVQAYKAGQAVASCRITDLKEYKAEVKRRRQIGTTIDPTTAETIFWFADMNDPYDILDEEYHEGQWGREQFARNPGGPWVDFDDLPDVTREALWQRDGHKLVFPYGLDGDYDVINKPPCRPKHSARRPK